MALSRIQTAEIVDNAVTTGKVDDATVIGTDIVDGTITNAMVASGAAIAHTKCAVGSVASLNVGTSANQILQLDGSGNLPALDGTQLTGIVSDFTPVENSMARLGLHLGAVEQLAKFNMIDQVIDDYEDATGVDASASTNETLAGSAGAKYYSGSSNSNQTLVSTTTTAESTATKADIVLQTEDATGTATINTDVKAGVSRDALNYIPATLAKIGTWGSGNVYAANDVTVGPGLVMTKVVTVPTTTLTETNLTLDSSNYATYVKTRANDGIVLRYGDFDYSGGAASDEITVDYGPIVDGDFWGSQASGGLWATHSLAPNINNVIHVFKDGVTFKPNGTQVAAWMDGANNQTAYRLYGIDSSFNGTQLVEWSATTVTNNQLYTGTASNSTFFPAFSINWSSANGGNSCSTNRMSFDGTMKSTTTIPAKLVTDGVSQDTLTLTEGYTYKFDTSDSTMSGHTFSFATAADAAGSTQYTTGVTTNGTPGNAGAYTQIVVAASAPTLYYYCANHASMGGTANTPAEAATTNMRYRVDTKNQSASKITRVHGTSLAWS